MSRDLAKIARGHELPNGWVKSVINLDRETHDEVRAGAVANNCSWSAQARMLIEVGLETLKEGPP